MLVDPTVKQKMLDLGIEAKASDTAGASARLKSDIEEVGQGDRARQHSEAVSFWWTDVTPTRAADGC